MAASTLVRPAIGATPRSFVPPGDRSLRLAHLDPRPLWRDPVAAISPWRSPSFWLAWALVAPIAGLARLARSRR